MTCMSCDHIKTRIRHYLIDGEKILMDSGVELRWLDRGQEFEDGDYVYEALESGIYTNEYGGRWMFLGDFKTMEAIYFDPILKGDSKEFEAWGWGVMASKALRSMTPDRSKPKPARK